MQISIRFNWPLGQRSARVGFGLFSIEDPKYEFMFGIIKEKEKDKIYGPQKWLSLEEMEKIGEFDVKMEDIIIVKKKEKKTGKILNYKFDIKKEWPESAFGDTFTNVPFDF